MSNIYSGNPFPDFKIDKYDTKSIRAEKRLFIILWNTDCYVCNLTLPYINRFQNAFPEIMVLGICQDSKEKMEEYCKKNQIDFAQASDKDLKVSNLLGVHTIPCYWFLDDTTVLADGRGWDKNLINGIAEELAESLGKPYKPLITINDSVPSFKPGMTSKESND